MRERHSALVLNIGTFAKEDEAYELLNSLSMSLPFVIMVTSVLDALLAAVYLKWLHPWRILLQEESCFPFEFIPPYSSFISFSRNQAHGHLRKMRRRPLNKKGLRFPFLTQPT